MAEAEGVSAAVPQEAELASSAQQETSVAPGSCCHSGQDRSK